MILADQGFGVNDGAGQDEDKARKAYSAHLAQNGLGLGPAVSDAPSIDTATTSPDGNMAVPAATQQTPLAEQIEAEANYDPTPQTPAAIAAPEEPPEAVLPDVPQLSDSEGFDAEATYRKLKQQQPEMAAADRRAKLQQRVETRSRQRTIERKQRLGKAVTDESALGRAAAEQQAGPTTDKPTIASGDKQGDPAVMAKLGEILELVTEIRQTVAELRNDPPPARYG